jgi:hypothetical protein
MDGEAAKRGKVFAQLDPQEALEVVTFVMRHRLAKEDADLVDEAMRRSGNA